MGRKPRYNKILTKKFLIREYIKNKQNTNQIARKVNCCGGCVLQYLAKYNIPRRTQSELNKGKNNGFYGKQHSIKTKKLISKVNTGRKVSISMRKLLRFNNAIEYAIQFFKK